MTSTSTPSPSPQVHAKLRVSESDLASAISPYAEDKFPAVFATSRLVAIMEIACARALVPLLNPGQLSVGVSIDVSHTAPTPEGAEVVAEAIYKGLESKLHLFDVVAKDEGGVVGKAVHKRAIVDVEKLEGKAKQRVPVSSGVL